jgi:hypothetical protein
LPTAFFQLTVSCANNFHGFSGAKKHGKMKRANHKHGKVSALVEAVGVHGKVRRVRSHLCAAGLAVLPTVADGDAAAGVRV